MAGVSFFYKNTANHCATDFAGNTASKTFYVSYIDGISPTLSVMITAASADRKGVITQLMLPTAGQILPATPFCWNYDPENTETAE